MAPLNYLLELVKTIHLHCLFYNWQACCSISLHTS